MANFLLVEDEPRIRAHYRSLLEKAGHICSEAEDVPGFLRAVEGSECGEELPIDLIILDHHLGVSTGLNALDTLHSILGPNCCKYLFVVATGSPDLKLDAAYRKYGSLGHLVKPIDLNINQFWATIEGALADERRYSRLGLEYMIRQTPDKQRELMQSRVEQLETVRDTPGLMAAYSDWLELCLCSYRQEDVFSVIGEMRNLTSGGRPKLDLPDYFEVLEGTHPYALERPRLREKLVNEYQYIAYLEVDTALHTGRSVRPFFDSIRRVLKLFSPIVEQEIVEYRSSRAEDAQDCGVEDSPILSTPSIFRNLKVAIIGGHSSTRDGIEEELMFAGVGKCVQVAPSNESYVSESLVQSKIQSCDLAALITGYMGHDLFRAVMSLHRRGAYEGQLLKLSCRGTSGVVREVVRKLESMPLKV
jgi:CheY-like chemotaxis protein